MKGRKEKENSFKIESDPEGKWIAAYVCTYCGTAHGSKESASQCWNSHTELTWEPIWGGIGSESDFPQEILLKRHERGFVTEIATYKKESIDKVHIREKRKNEKE